VSLQVRQAAEKEILRLRNRTGLPLKTLLEYAWIPQRIWHEWEQRRGEETRHNDNIPRNYHLTPQEILAISLYMIRMQ